MFPGHLGNTSWLTEIQTGGQEDTLPLPLGKATQEESSSQSIDQQGLLVS